MKCCEYGPGSLSVKELKKSVTSRIQKEKKLFFLKSDFEIQKLFLKQRYYTQLNDIKHNDVQHNDVKHNDIQHNDVQHNDI